MVCYHCGKPLASDARFCSVCGTQLLPHAPLVSPVRRMPRVAAHLQLLGILWILYGAMRLLAGMIGAIFVHGFFARHFRYEFGSGFTPFSHSWLHGFLPLVIVSTLLSFACTALTGYALLTRQPWGRILAIVFAVFALFNLPFGTALGVYTLWVLAPRESGLEYNGVAAQAHGR